VSGTCGCRLLRTSTRNNEKEPPGEQSPGGSSFFLHDRPAPTKANQAGN
jgi:hypothetical protein